MEYSFLFFNFFNFQRRNFWLRQIKVLLVILTLVNISSANRRPIIEFLQHKDMCGKQDNRYIDESCGTCGVSNERYRSKYVINGSPVHPHFKYPWMVSVQVSVSTKNYLCGGAIISSYFVLTAAHCVKKIENQPHMMNVSFLTRTQNLSPEVPVDAIYCHPQYKDSSSLFDIALIKLQDKITCDKYKSPVCLPPDNIILPPSTRLTFAGWGAVKDPHNPQPSDALLEGAIQTAKCKRCRGLFDIRKCRIGLSYCMLGVHDQAACFGDSGSPMFLPIKGRYQIHGIASSGDFLCRPGYPFLFVSVSFTRSWIKQVAGI